MILLLLFSISSTIRLSVVQKPKPNFFTWSAVNLRNAAENYFFLNRGFYHLPDLEGAPEPDHTVDMVHIRKVTFVLLMLITV